MFCRRAVRLYPVDMNLAKVRACFEANFRERGELGAAVSIWQEGEEVLSLSDGWRDRQQTVPWTPGTLVLVWSITKGLAAACLLHALAADRVALSTPVAALWPEFAAAGKAGITLEGLLSHQSGLAAMADPEASILDHAAVAAALEAQAPCWAPGTAHGYGPRTFGFLVDELLRRLRPGQTVSSYWWRVFAEPLGLDLWIGLPDNQAGRVASVYPARTVLGQEGPLGPFYEALADEKSLTRRAFSAPRGLHSVASMNTAEGRRQTIASFSGIGSAHALGRFYAMLANGGGLDGTRFFAPETVAAMSNAQVSGMDRVLCLETAFSAGFMQDPLSAEGGKRRQVYGPSLRAFGQPGAGGSHVFADPEHNLAFAYVMNQMELGVLPNEKSLSMVRALYER